MKQLPFLMVLVLVVAGCATAPRQTTNACAIFAQKSGFFQNWQKSAKQAERRYAIPMPIILATIYAESNFQHNARPRRTKLLGIFPWKRASSAYGYAQALDGTWDHYRRSTGDYGARRTDFEDAAHFIAWYHRQSVIKNRVNPNDAYNLYLNYYYGHRAFARGAALRSSASIRRAALRTQNMARRYDIQLRQCGRR